MNTRPDDLPGHKHGIPEESHEHEPKGSPSSDRHKTETVPAQPPPPAPDRKPVNERDKDK